MEYHCILVTEYFESISGPMVRPHAATPRSGARRGAVSFMLLDRSAHNLAF